MEIMLVLIFVVILPILISGVSSGVFFSEQKPKYTIRNNNNDSNNSQQRMNYSSQPYGDEYNNEPGFMTPNEFFRKRSNMNGDAVGVYILYNSSNGKSYVGQAKRVYFRVNQHLTGHGNGDVYADYKYGDRFLIKLVLLTESGYSDLDKLEKDIIRKYHAYDRGYNRNSGNG